MAIRLRSTPIPFHVTGVVHQMSAPLAKLHVPILNVGTMCLRWLCDPSLCDKSELAGEHVLLELLHRGSHQLGAEC